MIEIAQPSAAGGFDRQFERVFECAAIGMALVSLEGRLERVNRALCHIVGYAEEELLQLTFQDLTHPEDSPETVAHVQRLLEGAIDFYKIEKRYIHRDGHHVWVLVSVSLVRDESGSPVHFIGLVQDITEQRAARERLTETAAMLRIAGRVARLGGWTMEIPERTLTWSDENCAIHDRPAGYRPTLEEGINKYLPEHRATVMNYIEACATDGTPYEFELPIVTVKGRRLWVRSIGEAVRDASGKIIRVQGAFQDITERKRSEEALRESENELRAVTESMPQMVWMSRADGANVYSNQRWMDYTGLAMEEGRGDGWITTFHPDDKQSTWEAWQRALEAGGDFAVECRIRGADGGYRWMLNRGVSVRDLSGTITKWIGTCTDIDDLKEANSKLEHQASLLDKAQDAILVRDLDHRVLYWNRSAAQLYGWTEDELSNRSVRELIYRNSEAFRTALEITFERGEWAGEMEQYTKTGRQITVESRWSLVRDEQGKPASILVINTDVTARKQLEIQFLRAQRMESIGTLAGGIAHDFNNLLAPIVMGVGFLKRVETRENVLAVVRSMESSADRGKELVKQVLSFSRGVEGARVTIQLAHVVREVESIIASTFPRNISVEHVIAANLWPVVGDSTQLNQVLMNLSLNARDAMRDGGRLLITARNLEVAENHEVVNRGVAPGRYVVLEVADDGSGMPPEVVERVFEPFFTTRAFGSGTGLGLSTVLGIVQSHRGVVTVVSEVGIGTVFSVYLPAQVGAVMNEPVALAHESFPRGRGELVLVVDDEVSILNVTRQTLEEFGYRAIVAEDGARALALFKDHRDEVEVVITDVMMPGMDGYALIEALHEIDPELRIIAASGLVAESAVTAATAAGVKHFLTKPYPIHRLMGMLHSLISTPRHGSQTQ